MQKRRTTKRGQKKSAPAVVEQVQSIVPGPHIGAALTDITIPKETQPADKFKFLTSNIFNNTTEELYVMPVFSGTIVRFFQIHHNTPYTNSGMFFVPDVQPDYDNGILRLMRR